MITLTQVAQIILTNDEKLQLANGTVEQLVALQAEIVARAEALE